MLSGNGRHRRPRQAPALLVAAGVTGSAIAIPLLGATGASAAGGTTWDQVAECESGGSWSADSGNGRYGGLQLSQDDWDKYGGLDYAASPDQASRSQQIAVAEKVLAARGVSAWPVCGLTSGLNKDSGSAGVDTGLAGQSAGSASTSGSGIDSGLSESSTSSQSSTSAAPSTSSSPSSSPAISPSSSSPSSASPSSTGGADSAGGGAVASGSEGSGGSAAATSKSNESDKSGQNGASSSGSASDDTGAGRHRGGSADGGAAGSRTGDSYGRHASRGSGDARATADGSYTVRPGDSLSTIADSLDVTGGWAALYDANKATVGADPNLILPGQSLALDVEAPAAQH
ncbi:peptigoglycan-binding protein LysM [Streptomyces hygroscopicus]|uniref:LysM peptidoglycan-binding domain-containing protein n=1 Tax=Streptomyces hygroscopicus TaxID=1912 RepID=UPI00223EA2F9|nr:transglycosylase family protein [Streptomyces hygroscopicus]MCW7943297.1 peptigoglycan-binding protein LysM [Streptomyces hygroscopicus]